MIIPIVCYTEDCANLGKTINVVRGILPSDVDDFFEGYDGDCAEDWCPTCHVLGVAEDPFMEHEWENRYFEKLPSDHLSFAI